MARAVPGNALAGTASFLFRTMTLALLKYLQSFSEMSVHVGPLALHNRAHPANPQLQPVIFIPQ